MGPSLTLHDPLKSSPETSVTVAPGKHPATDSMSWKAAQVSAIPAGTVKVCASSKASGSCRREHGPSGQHRREVPAVVGVTIEVRGRVGALARRRRGGSHPRDGG